MKTNPAFRFTSRKRALSAAAFAAPLVLSGLLAAGCGSGGSSPVPVTAPSTVDTIGAARDVQTGQIALNGLLASSNTASASALQTVGASFASAHAKDPNNTQASVLLGLTQIAVAAQDVADAAAPLGDSRASIPFADLSRFQLKNWGGLRSSLIGKGKTRAALLASPLLLAQSAGKTSKGRATVDSARLRAALENLRTVIGNSLPLIQQGADDPNFAFGLTDFITNTETERVMDRADVAVIVSALYETRAGLSLALAYDTNVGSADFAQTIAARFPTKNLGDTLTPDEYLPASPFGTLTGDGKGNFASAKTEIATGADKGQTALTYLQGRTNSQLHLIDSADLTNQDYLTAKFALTGLKAALDGPVTVPLGDSSITLNLNAWFNNPPASLRAFFPTYTVGTDASDALVLQATAASYPDLTFGGLVVGTSGIPAKAFDMTIPTDKNLGDLLFGFLGGLEDLDL